MLLCLDVGNSNIFGGIFENDKIILRFRLQSRRSSTSDEIGIFLTNVLHENGIKNDSIEKIAISSVVPEIDYSLTAACKKYFALEPFFLKSSTIKNLKIKFANPQEIGADLLATALAARNHYADDNLIIIDFGTATTLTAVTNNGEFLGGLITPGLRLSMEALHNKISQLPAVELKRPTRLIGTDTIESMQAGLYYSQAGLVREIVNHLSEEAFAEHPPVVVATGGFAHLFADEEIFNVILQDLVLEGLYLASKN